MEFRSVHIFEHSESGGAIFTQGGYSVGDAAAGSLRWTGTGPRGIGDRHETEVVVCHRSALGLVAGPGGDRDADVGGCAAEDLEQHAHRNESGATPAVAAEGAHGRAIQPDQSALFV